MIQIDAPILAHETFGGPRELLTLHLPSLAPHLHAGQMLAIRPGYATMDPVLRRAVTVVGADSGSGTASIFWDEVSGGAPKKPIGDSLDVLGPIGRGWTLGGTTRNVLLVGVAARAGALLFLADTASRRGCNVALLVGAEGEGGELPPSLVPSSVEYQFARATDSSSAALDLLATPLLQWADALYTTLPFEVYPALAQQIRHARVRWDADFAYGLIAPPMACFVGICDTCRVEEARRPWRACVDGPECRVREFMR